MVLRNPFLYKFLEVDRKIQPKGKSSESRRKQYQCQQKSISQSKQCSKFLIFFILTLIVSGNEVGDVQHNSVCAKALDFYFDALFAVFCEEKSILPQFADLIASKIIRTPIARRKASSQCSFIGCKTLLNDVWTLINRARSPALTLARVLSILNQIVQLQHIANKIEKKGKSL